MNNVSQQSDADRYRNGAYEIHGYATRDDMAYGIYRNIILIGEQDKSKPMKEEWTRAPDTSTKMQYRDTAAVWNGFQVSSYVPVIGIVPGVINITRGAKVNKIVKSCDPKKARAWRRAAVIRGIVQTVGLGILYLPADIYVTAKRKRHPANFADLERRARQLL